MYSINYNLNNGHWEKYDFCFNTLWGATFTARAISIQHWADVDVIDMTTGVVLVSFNRAGGYYVDEELPNDIKKLATAPID